MRYLLSLACLLVVGSAFEASASGGQKLPLHVLYLARDNEADREQAFSSFLKEHFAKASVVKRSEFQPPVVDGVDVVLLDWSQQEERAEDYPSPLGKLEDWDMPTVFLGSAGLLIAGPWYVIGGAG